MRAAPPSLSAGLRRDRGLDSFGREQQPLAHYGGAREDAGPATHRLGAARLASAPRAHYELATMRAPRIVASFVMSTERARHTRAAPSPMAPRRRTSSLGPP